MISGIKGTAVTFVFLPNVLNIGITALKFIDEIT